MNSGQNVIVTGAAGGIGQALALQFAAAGASVLATDLDRERLDGLLQQASGLPGRLLAVAGNMLDPALGTSLVAAARAAFGEVQVLVNCSGLLQDNRIRKMPLSQFRRLADINLAGPLRLIDAVTPSMVAAGFGRIISISSRAWLGNFGSSGYSCAKGGVVGASRSLALALAPHGITVNCIAPGFIDTPMSRSLPPHILERVVQAIPVGRTGSVDDVSSLVRYLAARESGYITGQTILVCGGRSISNPIT